MAKLSDAARLDVANKLALGIASTNTDKNYFEEEFPWTPTVLASEIWADDVPFAATPLEADDIAAGLTTDSPTSPVVEKLTLATMDEIPLSNGQGWTLYDVAGVPDPTTRIVDWLNPQSFGPGYFIALFENDNTPIALTDGRYQIDNKNGVVRFDEGFTPSDLGLLTPLKVTLYRYDGRKGVFVGDIPAGGGGGGDAGVPHQETVTFINVIPANGNTNIGSTSFSVANPESFKLFVNKLMMVQGQDYSLTGPFGNEIVWLIDNHGVSLINGEDQLVACYSEESIALPLVPRQQELIPEDVSATSGDTILTDTLDVGIANPESVRLFHNKLLQVQGATRDYSLTGPGFTQIIWQPQGGGLGTAQPLETTDELVAAYLQDADLAIGPTGPTGPPSTIFLTEVSTNAILSQEIEQYVGLLTSGTGGFTVTLPAAPIPGDRVWFKDQDGAAGTNNVEIDGNGNPIDGDITANLLIDIDEQALMVKFAFGEWRIF
jgi:hypothetical protein